MPPPLRRGLPRRDPTIVLPEPVALALRPSADRTHVPAHFTLAKTSQPLGGETREEQPGPILTIPNNGQKLACTLRRAWTFVGFAVDPGDAGAAGLKAILKVITNGVQGFFAAQAIANGVGPQAFPGIIVGARAELWLLNQTGAAVHNVKATIWGMSER